MKITALFLVGVFHTGSALMFRTICQEGFSVVVSKTTSVVDLLLGKTESDLVQEELTPEQREQLEKDKITFSHENKNIDSGRKKLWLESINLFKLSPIIGISNGNIVLYSAEYSNGALEYSYHKSDLHNGFLTILVSTGVIGFVLFGIFGFRFAKHSAHHHKRYVIKQCLFKTGKNQICEKKSKQTGINIVTICFFLQKQVLCRVFCKSKTENPEKNKTDYTS